MARRSVTARPPRRRGVLRHYDRPLHRNRLFLLVAVSSVLATTVFVAAVVLLTGLPDEPLDWLRPGVLGLLVLLLSFRLLGMGVTSTQKFHEGLTGASGHDRTPGSATTGTGRDYEATGRAAGAVVGKALRSTRAASSAASTSSPETSPTTPPAGAGDVPRPDAREPAASGDPADAPEGAPSAGPGRGDGGTTASKGTTAARVAGAMVGRRLAERRRREEH